MPYRSLVAQRRLEWWLASYTTVWGLCLVALPQSFAAEPYTIAQLWAPAPAWGGLAGAIGMFHLWALYINGRREWSAHVRAAATIGNAAIFTLILGAMIAAVWHGLAPLTVTLTLAAAPVWAAVCAFWVAAHDSYVSFCRTRGARGI